MTDSGFLEAKSFLLETSDDQSVSLYDHLSEVLLQVLEKKPKNVLESFEALSHNVKRDRLDKASGNAPKKASLDAPLLSVAKLQIKLFDAPEGEGDAPEMDTVTPIVPNVVKEQHVFEQCGVGFGREETVLLQFAIQSLAKTVGDSVVSLRFWGKILGTNTDYYVVEGTMADGAAADVADLSEQSSANIAAAGKGSDDAGDDNIIGMDELDDTPKPNFKKPTPVPTEVGQGVNKHCYWVCSEPSKPWAKLPSVTPAHISIARKIKKLFTGSLAAPVHSYPPFPGTEAHLLRAQIARISASTQVSPLGYFAFTEEEADEEDAPLAIETVQDFEGLAMEELGKVDQWAHHSQFLLQQGRVTWWSAKQNDEDQGDDGEDDEEEEEPVGEEPETAPPLLASAADDVPNDAQYGGAWSAKTFPSYAPEVACISSNNWPGAYAVATDRGTYFRNIYVGWGLKHSSAAFVPPPIKTVEIEYDKPLSCAQDPTVEEEQALEEEREDKEGGDLDDDASDGEGDDD